MSSSSQIGESWISSFCSLLGHEYFAEISEDFIEDDFNLTGLAAQVPMYKDALEMILDVEPEDDEDEEEEIEEDDDEETGEGGMNNVGFKRTTRHSRMASDLSVIESSAETLYGLIHQRYITSRPGMQQMLDKYEMGHFGICPRVLCNGAKVLPVGCSDAPQQDTVKLFCPSCLDIYTPPNSRFQSVDGAFFGTTFGCLFFMTFPELEIGRSRSNAAAATALMQLHQQHPSVQSENGADLGATASRTPSSSSTQLSPSLTITLKPRGSPPLGTTTSLTTLYPYGAIASGHMPPQPSTINGTPTAALAPSLGAGNIYEPRIYGFRVSERARTGPRMQWLRSKPLDINELDEVNNIEMEMAEILGTAPGPGGEADAPGANRKDGVGLDGDEIMPDAGSTRAKGGVRKSVNGRTAKRKVQSDAGGVAGDGPG